MEKQHIGTFSFSREWQRIRKETAEQAAHRLIVYPEGDMVSRHLSADSQFCRACVGMGYLTQAQMHHAAERYRLGISRDGGVIFWQLNLDGRVLDGKIMYYRADCHRDHSHHPTWVGAEMTKFYLADSPDVADLIDVQHHFFGLHLLAACREEQTICVVEAEKTAVILSEHYPQYLWMAAGGLSALKPEMLYHLRHHKIVLFPDTDPDGSTFRQWYDIARRAEKMAGKPIHVSPLLEQRATPAQKERKIDLVDFLFP